MSSHFKQITIPVHIIGLFTIGLIVTGRIESKYLILSLIGWILISGFGIAVGFHRYFSHNAFETYPVIEKALAYLGCLGAQGSPLFWASLHNGSHHRYSDSLKDLHSPIHGKWHAYMGWQINLKPEQVPFRAGVKLARKPYQKFLHKNYNRVFWGTAIALTLVDWRLGLFGMMIPSMISIHQENLIDLFCHLPSCGYRNHDTKDQSVNVYLLGFFAFGQGWHNNHHARPNDYNFGGEKWWEFDICNILVPLIAKRPKTDNRKAQDEVRIFKS